MKKLYFCITLLAGLLLMSGCSKDDSNDNDDVTGGNEKEQSQQEKNVLSFDNTKVDVVGAKFDNVVSQGEVTSIPISLYLDENGDNYLSIEIEGADLGKEIDLTKRDNSFWIIYNNGSIHYNWYQNDNGTSADSFVSGSSARIIRNNGGVYTVDVNIVFTSGVGTHTLTAHYKGVVGNNWIDK